MNASRRAERDKAEATHWIKVYLLKDATGGSSCVYHGPPATQSYLHQLLNKQANTNTVNDNRTSEQ